MCLLVADGANVSEEPVASIYMIKVPEDGSSKFHQIIGTSLSKYITACLRTR
jgi:hypothetical protein